MRRHIVYDKRTGQIDELPCDQSQSFDPMQLLHDCPECSAALARGEQPTFLDPRTGEEIDAEEAKRAGEEILARARPRSIWGRRPRWRDLKRKR